MRKKTLLVFLFSAALTLSAVAGGNRAAGPSSGNPLEGSLAESLGGKISVSCYDSLGYRSFLEEAAKLF
ncbi:MAG: hypothetical protein LBH26_07610, partial [Treponema sp.]|nr:hypothetical protein [Treponema sp.]